VDVAATTVQRPKAVRVSDPGVSGTARVAYLIPEFPGQTHILFWRELRELSRLGVHAELVSTRRPEASVVCHEWSREAIKKTVYLFPPGFLSLIGGLGAVVRAGPAAWVEACMAAMQTGERGLRRWGRLAGLAVMGGILADRSRRGRWRHIHVHCCGDSAYVAMFSRIFGGAEYSLVLHGALPWFGLGHRAKWARAAFGVAVTQRLRREILGEIGEGFAPRVYVAPMGVDLQRFTRELPLDAKGPDEAWRIVSCGRLHEGKGHQDVLRALAILRGGGIRAWLTILGEGEERALLERLANELGLKDVVRFAGAASEDVVRAELGAADAFALGSHAEAIGVATMEAMAMGLPVVVTGVDGVPELVRHGVDGLLVPARDPAAMAAGLKLVHDDRELAARLGASAAERVRESFGSRVSAELLARKLGVPA